MKSLRQELRLRIVPGRAESSAWFFKTGPGEYGEGDQFLGIPVPEIRAVAKLDDGRCDRAALLHSKWHEERLLALLILVRRFERGDEAMQCGIYETYLSETQWINNWDLVDSSAPQIVGTWLLRRPRGVLRTLACSTSLWERRIAIISTFAFLRAGELDETFRLAKLLLRDPEPLIHKACGWMLREAGKRRVRALEEFLDKHAPVMPRTMLRYAIEKIPEKRRKQYMAVPCQDV
ncbi:MAG: DNA alkylation repair protein [Terrimicrobiaceae bacterium]